MRSWQEGTSCGKLPWKLTPQTVRGIWKDVGNDINPRWHGGEPGICYRKALHSIKASQTMVTGGRTTAASSAEVSKLPSRGAYIDPQRWGLAGTWRLGSSCTTGTVYDRKHSAQGL